MNQNRRSSMRFFKADAIGVVVAAGLFALWYGFAVRPVQLERAEASAQQTRLADAQRQEEDLAADITRLSNSFEQVNARLAESRFKLDPIGRLNAKVADIARLATSNGLTVHTVQPGTVVAAERYRAVEIVLSGEGTYVSLSECLSAFRSEFPDVGITEVSTARNGVGSGSSFSMNCVWYASPTDSAGSAGPDDAAGSGGK